VFYNSSVEIMVRSRDMKNMIFSTCELVFTSVVFKGFCCCNVVIRWRSRPVVLDLKV